MRKSAFAVAVLALFVASVASATTIVLPTDDQLIAKSPVIVAGTVTQSFSVERDGGIWTETRLAVERVIKGQVNESTLTIREVGGRIEDRVSVVFGAAEYKPGERVMAFLIPTSRGDYQTRDLFVGKFTEEISVDGRRLWFRPETRANTMLLDGSFRPIEAKDVQRDADRFERYVAERVAGRRGDANYGVESPVVRPRRIESNFVLIGEPDVYRWFAFDKGSSVSWVSVSTQPGYADGGISETKASLQTWNGVAGAQIRYVYSGASTVSPGGLSRSNGINEIIFNDVTNEVDGTWDRSTGGVVGRGGFNRVVNGGAWTSPFNADPEHPQKTYSGVGNITEGNLVIQDGVSPANGISSTTLNAIIAHEFGHTLGFGHSEDGTALMYYTVRAGGGAALGADDQKAAQWLYPGSTGGTPPPPPPTTPTLPAAPSNLRAAAIAGTVPQVQLTWTVNATNATAQQIYGAEGTASFAPVGGGLSSVATSATLTNLVAGRTYRFYVTARNSAGESAPSNTVTVTLPAATTSGTLALNSSRFRVTLAARDQRTAKTGAGQAIPQNDLFGYFSIPALTNDASNPEVFVKVLDGSGANGYFWVFYGGLTDLEYTITVQDTRTGRSKVYHKDPGSACGGFDTTAFPGSTSGVVEPAVLDPEEILEETLAADAISAIRVEETSITADACSTSSTSLCLNSSRFRVSLAARDQRTGKTGTGNAMPQNSLFGYFSIPALTGTTANPEVFVKVLDGRAVNGRFWVFYGGLTDLEYTLTVTDTVTGAVKRYTKAGGSACGGFDTAAF